MSISGHQGDIVPLRLSPPLFLSKWMMMTSDWANHLPRYSERQESHSFIFSKQFHLSLQNTVKPTLHRAVEINSTCWSDPPPRLTYKQISAFTCHTDKCSWWRTSSELVWCSRPKAPGFSFFFTPYVFFGVFFSFCAWHFNLSWVYKPERVLCEANSVLFHHLVDRHWTPEGLCRWGGPRPRSHCEAAGQREKNV